MSQLKDAIRGGCPTRNIDESNAGLWGDALDNSATTEESSPSWRNTK